MPITVAVAQPDDPERWLSIAWAIDRDEHIAARSDRHVPRGGGTAILHEVRDDESTETSRQGETSVVGITSHSTVSPPFTIPIATRAADRRR